MPRLLRLLLLLAPLAGCTPTFNWREVRFESAPLVALLPCKPDRATRDLPLAGQPRPVSMMGCEAGGATFTIATASLGSDTEATQALAQWKTASRASQARYYRHEAQIFEVAVFGTPRSHDSPGVLSQQAVETFFGGVQLPGK